MLIRIATRRSRLALAQSRWVQSRLAALDSALTVELREYVTRGDRVQDVPLAQVGGKGLFTREIEEALLAGEAEVAVHSLKDLPAELPAGLVLAAVPEREDARDALVLPAGAAAAVPGADPLALLPRRARVGSSSFRRAAQLLHARPDLHVESVRGNVDTRLRKLDAGDYDALVLAAAGLRRLGLGARISAALPPALCTPAPGQGALGLEASAAAAGVLALLARLEDAGVRRCVTAERALMESLGGGCSIPLGAHARLEGETLHLAGMIALPDGSRLLRVELSGPAGDPGSLGRAAAEALRARGAAEILRALPGGASPSP